MSIEALCIPEEKKNYITKQISPLLEELVTDVITDMPEDPAVFMYNWLGKKTGKANEIESLQNEIAALRQNKTETATEQHLHEDTEEEDDDDDVDSIPEDFKVKETTSNRPRCSVSAEVYGAWNQKKAFEPPVHPKDDAQKDLLIKILSSAFMFSNLATKDRSCVIDALEKKEIEPDTRIIKQGDDGDFMFIIESGQFECLKMIDGSEVCVKTCVAGDIFGELALLYNVPRAASVVSKENCVCWQLDRETFNHIVKESACKKRERYEEFLKKCPLLETMDQYERAQVSDAFKTRNLKSGDVVIKQGDTGDAFYILESGNCEADKNGKIVCTYDEGDYFGELALLKDDPRAATVKAVTDCTLLVLDRSSFRRLLGPLTELLNRKYN